MRWKTIVLTRNPLLHQILLQEFNLLPVVVDAFEELAMGYPDSSQTSVTIQSLESIGSRILRAVYLGGYTYSICTSCFFFFLPGGE